MKTGIILYLLGGEQGPVDPELGELQGSEMKIRGLPFQPDCLRLGRDQEELVDYWKEMTVQGMKRIVCMLAKVQADNVLEVGGRELVLSGY